MKPKLCICGCKQVTNIRKGTYNRFIEGHNRRKVSKGIIQLIRKKYLEDLMSIDEIAKQLKLGSTTIKRYITKLGINRDLSEAQKVSALKGKHRMKTKIGKRIQSIKMRGQSYNRIYEYNRSFFSRVNNHSAYILGLILADGCISRKQVIILTLKDKEILEKIAKVIGEKLPIYKNGYYHLIYCSHEMANDLQKLGAVGNKTFRLNPPKIPNHFIKPFIRGFFDGDGGFSYNKRTHQIISFFDCSSKPFLEWIKSQLSVVGGTIRKRKNTNCFELRFSTADTILLGNFIYEGLKDDDLFLNRKLSKFMQLKNTQQ